MENTQELEAKYVVLTKELRDYRKQYMDLKSKHPLNEDELKKISFLLNLAKCETLYVYKQLQEAHRGKFSSEEIFLKHVG